MANTKPPTEERAIIVRQPATRRYGVRAGVHLQTAGSIGDIEGVCLLLDSGAFITMEPRKKAPWEGGDKFSFTLEGYPTATLAEAGGRRLVQALLWTAVSLNFALRLEYATYEPTVVFDRTQPAGVRIEGFGTVGWSADRVLQELGDSYAQLPEPEVNLLLSMEIFAGPRIEVSQRARFLAIVSALEPLAVERPLGQEVDQFVDLCLTRLDEHPSMPGAARASLQGRLQTLRKESIRQAILRVVRDTLPNRPVALEIVDQGYAVRSEIVHSGRPADLDLDLEQFGHQIGNVLREIYAARLSRDLAVVLPSSG